MTIVKRGIAVVITVHCLLAVLAGYRSWYQIHSLDLSVSVPTLRAGSTVDSKIVSYARNDVDVRLEIVQGDRAETIGTHRVRANRNAGYNPLIRSARPSVVLTDEMLSGFEPGTAVVRATAIGRHQWMRLPPPVVREVAVALLDR